MSALGTEIQRLRKAAELTQVQLAARLEMSQGFVAMLETGKKSIATTALLFKLCDALGVGCDHFRPFLVEVAEDATPVKTKRSPAKRTKKSEPG